MENRVPSIVDLNAELAKLTMFRRFPEATAADRKGSVARLASYRDGPLLAIKAAGRDHWERHLTGDELIYVLDGTATLDGMRRRAAKILRAERRDDCRHSAGCMAPFPFPEGFTQMAAAPFPGETVELDVDDPRTAESKAM